MRLLIIASLLLLSAATSVAEIIKIPLDPIVLEEGKLTVAPSIEYDMESKMVVTYTWLVVSINKSVRISDTFGVSMWDQKGKLEDVAGDVYKQAADAEKMKVLELLYIHMSPKTFVRVLNADRLTLKIGILDIKLTEEQLKKLQENFRPGKSENRGYFLN